jgi:hypothetical protein
MTKTLVSQWFNALAEAEKDLPLLIVQDYAYTPRMAYDEVMRETSLGQQLQALIERGSFGTSASDERTIAKLRLEQRLKSQPERPLFATLSGKVFTPSELLAQIQEGTSIGNQWLNNEISHMKKLVQVR